MEDNSLYWFNYVKQEYEFRESPTDFSDYVPQIGGRELYQLYVKTGKSPAEAAIAVLTAAIDTPPQPG